MTDYLQAVLENSFLLNAVLAGILASIACGLVGTFVVIKKISYLSGGIAHAVLGGVGLALFLGVNPLAGALVFAVLAAVIIGLVKLNVREHEDTIIAAIWSIGMALGVVFIYLTPGYNIDLMTYLFGNILLVSRLDLLNLIILDIVLILFVLVFYRQFIAISFDDEFSAIRGLQVKLHYIILLILISLSIVVMIRIVGLILIIALLTLPAAISRFFTRTPGSMMAGAVAGGLIFTNLGLFLSYQPGLPPSAVIIILCGIGYLLALLIRKKH